MGHENPPGTYANDTGSLYRLDRDRVTKWADGIGISNGMAWDLNQKAMYYIDSLERNIPRYDYDDEDISNMRYIFDFEENGIAGLPDGATIDTDGNLWVAVFNGSCVINIDPKTEELLRKIPLPVRQVTSVTFGGANLDILFVTTANMIIDGPNETISGGIFAVTGLGVNGLPGVNYKI